MACVLVINDDPVQLHFLSTLLEQDQYHVTRCHSAEEGYEVLQNQGRVDLIVIDLHLPGMSGWRFCRLIHSLPAQELRTLPILVVSATYSGFDEKQIKSDLQVHGFLPLPVEPQRFRECVRQIADGTIKPATLRVLLVEEPSPEADRLSQGLEELGWLVTVAQSGLEARQYGQRPFDIVIANHELSDMTGVELLRELKRDAPSMVSVLFMADSHSVNQPKAFQLGIDAWFSKPYDPSHVVSVCQKVRQEQAFARVEALLETRTNSLRDSETQFRTLFESLPDVLMVYDRTNLIRHINRLGAQQLGYVESELVGRPIHGISPSAQARSDSEHRNGSDAIVEQWRETYLLGKNGDKVDVEMIERSVMYAGKPGTLIVARDMTSRKQMESDKETLEQQLRQAQKMEAIGRLAAGVAHDVNNILAAILGHASLLKVRSDSKGQFWQTGDVIDKAVRRGQQLTSQLLGFARQGKHHHVSVDVHGVIQEVVSLLSRTLEKSIALSPVLDASHRWVMGDPNQLYQVLMNLALNACDAMPQGGTLTISTANELIDAEAGRRKPGLVPGSHLLVKVADSGVGIPQDIKNKIFEPFFTTKEKGKGTGMGLAMTYGIVKNHQGYIGVSSEAGEGTTMNVYLPVTGESSENNDSDVTESLFLGHGNILVVDDDEVVAGVAAELLEHLGYHVAIVTSGDQAVEYCQRHPGGLDLVLLDMIMEGMNGAECFSALRQLDPRLNVIMCTGYDRNHAIQELLNQGVVGFIQKPYDITELSQVVGDVLAGARLPKARLTSMDKQPIEKQHHPKALVG